jgi:hypothetical protein
VIDTTRGAIASSAVIGNAGDVTLEAARNIDVQSIQSFVSSSGTGGDISLTSETGRINTTAGEIISRSFDGLAGNVSLEAPLDIRIGDITASSVNDGEGFNEVRVNSSQGSIFVDDASVSTSNSGSGFAGEIIITGGDRVVIRRSRLSNTGYGGYIIVQAPTEIRIIDSRLEATTTDQRVLNPLFRSTIAVGSEGSVTLNNSSLSTTNSTDSNTTRDTAGDVVVTAGRRVSISGRFVDENGNEHPALSSEGYLGRVSIGSVPDNLNTSTSLGPFVARFNRVEPRNVVIDGATVTSSTTTAVNRNEVGEVNINATDSIRIRNESSITTTTASQNRNANDGGNININTRLFRLVDDNSDEDETTFASLDASTLGQGNAGNITIEANDILLDNVVIFNNAETRGSRGSRGDAGNITIGREINDDNEVVLPADTVRLTGGSEIQSGISVGRTEKAAARGDGGTITVNARDIVLDNGSQIFTSVGGQFEGGGRLPENAVGTGGNINITANSLRLINDPPGPGGDPFTVLDARAFNDLSRAGSITIDTDQLHLQNSRVNVNNEKGEAGSISVTTGSISLDNSSLTAVAGEGDGGNINLITPTTLVLLQDLENQSVVSAEALADATGGNVTLNVRDGFILTNANDNTDIVANAQGGDGGVIEINTQQIFGLEDRDGSFLSDLNASSESGNPGRVTLNTLSIDPTRGLGELPIQTVDTASLVAEGCVGRNRSGVTNQGEFTRTGRGGLSPNPSDPLNSDAVIDQLATLDFTATQTDSVSIPDAPSTTDRLIEAQGLARDASGKVSLVSNSSATPDSSSSVSTPPICIGPQS